MKKLLLFITLLLAGAAQAAPPPTAADSAARYQAQADSINASMHYEQGTVLLPGGIGLLRVPAGFRYLDSAQTRRVMTQLWGNPPSESLGMIFPADRGPMSDDSWAFVIRYDEMGYVKDDDADDIKYDELLEEMKNDVAEENKERKEAGYGTVELLGWASPPFYDKYNKVLHWAKKLQFEGEDQPTLNYNVRLLGRKGVLVLNAIGSPDQLARIKASIPAVSGGVSFAKGLQYADFDTSIDEVAAYSIGGLVAGKVLAKVGFFALILKFWKVALVTLASGWGAVKRFFGGKSEE